MRHRCLAQGITVFVAVAMPLFVGLVGLALDAGHLYAVHTDLAGVGAVCQPQPVRAQCWQSSSSF